MTAQPYPPPAQDRPADADADVIVVSAYDSDDEFSGDDFADDSTTDNSTTDYNAPGAGDDITGDAGTGDADAAGDRPGPAATGPQAADLGQQWHDIQAMFVDDPRGSVQLAAAAAAAAVDALAETLRQHQADDLSDPALDNDPAPHNTARPDTEQLREALRGYRIFCQSLADSSRQLPQLQVAGS